MRAGGAEARPARSPAAGGASSLATLQVRHLSPNRWKMPKYMVSKAVDELGGRAAERAETSMAWPPMSNAT